MFNNKIRQLLIGSTILSSFFSLIIIAMTIVHHLKIQESIDDLKNNGFI